LKIRLFVLLKSNGRVSENRYTKKQMWQNEEESLCILGQIKTRIYYVISAELHCRRARQTVSYLLKENEEENSREQFSLTRCLEAANAVEDET